MNFKFFFIFAFDLFESIPYTFGEPNQTKDFNLLLTVFSNSVNFSVEAVFPFEIIRPEFFYGEFF